MKNTLEMDIQQLRHLAADGDNIYNGPLVRVVVELCKRCINAKLPKADEPTNEGLFLDSTKNISDEVRPQYEKRLTEAFESILAEFDIFSNNIKSEVKKLKEYTKAYNSL